MSRAVKRAKKKGGSEGRAAKKAASKVASRLVSFRFKAEDQELMQDLCDQLEVTATEVVRLGMRALASKKLRG